MHYNWTNQQIFRTTEFYVTYVRYIDHDESDMKEDILSVSELPARTVSDKKSDLSHYFQDKKWVAKLTELSDIFSSQTS